MRYIDEEVRPKVLDAKSLSAAIVLHVVFFACCWYLSLPMKEKEVVIPIELTFEAPPAAQPEPEPEPKPAPKPVVKPQPRPPEPPKVEERDVDAVVRVPPRKPPKKKPEAKPKEPEKPKPVEKPKEPEKPKKTAAELRRERLERMRQSAVKDDTPKTKAPSGSGKKLEKDWQKLLNQGYRPGDVTQLAASEEQRCMSLINRAFHSKWEQPPWTSSLKSMVLKVTFGPGGKVVAYSLLSGSGDAKADRSVLSAAKRVTSVAGLSSDFLAKYPSVTVTFKVTP